MPRRAIRRRTSRWRRARRWAEREAATADDEHRRARRACVIDRERCRARELGAHTLARRRARGDELLEIDAVVLGADRVVEEEEALQHAEVVFRRLRDDGGAV